jgi:L-ascorbate metabolism protein UlaG (beta-lactamase superfamily)
MRKVLTLSVLLCLFLLPAFAEDELTIAYLGHSCFTITATDGTIVMIDPYDEYLPYPALPKPADVLLVTHEHVDHNAVDRVEGHPTIVRGLDNKGNVVEKEQTVEAIPIKSIAASHGPGRGNTALFVFVVDGVHFVPNYCPWPFDPVDTFLNAAEAKWPVFAKASRRSP